MTGTARSRERTTVPGILASTVERFGDRTAVVDDGTELTYRDLTDRSLRFGGALVASGIEPGDRVAIWACNCTEWIVAALGLWQAGAVLVPVNTRCKGVEAADVLVRSRARLLVTVTDFLGTDYVAMLRGTGTDLPDLETVVVARGPAVDRTESWGEFTARATAAALTEVEDRSAAVTPDDPCDILFTSGTTGTPKGVVQTHGGTTQVAADWVAMTGLGSDDRYLMVNPYFHMFGLKAGILAAVTAGATMLPEPVFDVDRVVARVAAERVTVLPGPPTLYQELLDHPDRDRHDLSTLRVAVTGAADIPVELIRRVDAELPFSVVITGYGLTEGGTAAATSPSDDVETIATTVGRPRPGFELRIVDDEGRDVDPGQPGEILLRGGSIMSHYLDDPEATAEARSPDGWLRTGDLGVVDPDGLPAHRRPLQGHVHRGRVQRLPCGDRERPAAASRHRRGGGRRRPRRAPGRGGHGLRRRAAGCGADRRRCHRVVSRPDGQLQGPAGGGVRRRSPAQCDRQGAEGRPPPARGAGPLGPPRVSGPAAHGLSALTGLRVVELGVWVAAPSAAALLADWGADVIKVEAPTGDPMRNVFGSLGIGSDLPNPAFALDNRGKRSIVLDLHHRDERQRLEELLEVADVFICNLRPDALDKLDLEAEATVVRHPRLVYCAISGYGLHGEDRNRPTYDIGAFWARSGLSSQMADEHGNPLNARGGIGDHITGLAALSGILAAVLEQRATGVGRVVEVSLLRTGAYVLGWDLGLQMLLGKVSPAESRHHNQSPLMNPYRAADGRWFFLTGLEADRHIGPVARALGRPELLEDERFCNASAIRRNRTEFIALLDGIIAGRPLAEWAERFDREGVWWALAQTPAEVVDDPQLVGNDGFVDLQGGAVRSVNGPVTFSGVTRRRSVDVPALGADTDEVLAELADRRDRSAAGRPSRDEVGSTGRPVSRRPGPGPGGPGR